MKINFNTQAGLKNLIATVLATYVNKNEFCKQWGFTNRKSVITCIAENICISDGYDSVECECSSPDGSQTLFVVGCEVLELPGNCSSLVFCDFDITWGRNYLLKNLTIEDKSLIISLIIRLIIMNGYKSFKCIQFTDSKRSGTFYDALTPEYFKPHFGYICLEYLTEDNNSIIRHVIYTKSQRSGS